MFGGPFCGGAPYALAVYGARTGRNVTLFYAKRRDLHWRQEAAFKLGAKLYQVPAGRMTVVQKRARDYSADRGALFLPLGFDLKDATDPFEQVMRDVRDAVGPIDEVWCATGSGMLARCLGRAFPDSKINGVVVGLRSRNKAQSFGPNVELIDCPYDFDEPCSTPALVSRARSAPSRTLFWNVAPDRPQELEEFA